MKWLNGITDSMDMNLGKLQEMVRDKHVAWGHEESGTTWQQNNNIKLQSSNVHFKCEKGERTLIKNIILFNRHTQQLHGPRLYSYGYASLKEY